MKRLRLFSFLVFISLISFMFGFSTPAEDQSQQKEKEIEYFIEKGYISPLALEKNWFRPEDTMNTEDFFKYILLMKGIIKDPDFYTSFEEMEPHLLTMGLIEKGENYNRSFHREELAMFLIKLINEKPSEGEIGFYDDNRIKPEFKGYVKRAVELSLLDGFDDGTFRPGHTVSVGEGIKGLVRTLNPVERSLELHLKDKVIKDNGFRIPKIEIVYNTNIYKYRYFEVYIRNHYEFSDDYEFRMVYDEEVLNSYQNEGWYEHIIYKLDDWRPPLYLYNTEGMIGNIGRVHNTTIANKDKFKLYEGKEIWFTIHVKNKKTGEVRAYRDKGVIHRIDFYRDGSPF